MARASGSRVHKYFVRKEILQHVVKKQPQYAAALKLGRVFKKAPDGAINLKLVESRAWSRAPRARHGAGDATQTSTSALQPTRRLGADARSSAVVPDRQTRGARAFPVSSFEVDIDEAQSSMGTSF